MLSKLDPQKDDHYETIAGVLNWRECSVSGDLQRRHAQYNGFLIHRSPKFLQVCVIPPASGLSNFFRRQKPVRHEPAAEGQYCYRAGRIERVPQALDLLSEFS